VPAHIVLYQYKHCVQIRAAKLGVSHWLVCGHSASQLQPCCWCGAGGHYQPVSTPLYPQVETVTHSLSYHVVAQVLYDLKHGVLMSSGRLTVPHMTCRFWLVNQQDSNFQSELSAVVGSGPASYLLGMQQKGPLLAQHCWLIAKLGLKYSHSLKHSTNWCQVCICL
jgi:hypothetical protein